MNNINHKQDYIQRVRGGGGGGGGGGVVGKGVTSFTKCRNALNSIQLSLCLFQISIPFFTVKSL